MQCNPRQSRSFSMGQTARYRLAVLQGADSGPRIQVMDCDRGSQLFDWQGYVARHMLNSGELDDVAAGQCGCFPCDKYRVSHLALVAAAARMTLSHLPAAHRHVATTLLQNSDQHLSAADVRELIAIDFRGIVLQDVESYLGDLVRWELIQRIDVDGGQVFYDVDTRPHEHRFDPVAGRVYDA